MSDLGVQAMYAEAMLGRDAEEFLKTDLGRVMLARAEEMEQDAIEVLATVSPWRRRKIAQLQNEIKLARMFKGYLTELIVTGKQALQQLETPE